MEGNYKKWINRINAKQDVLTEDNVGEFMDLELSTKSTPTSGDTVLGRDSVTGKAVRIPTSSFGGGGSSLALGETSSTAYRGDRGKTAYDHSQTTGNPHGTTKNDIGLGNVNNTSDLDKPISTATQTALDLKVDKVNGKQLSTEDYTTNEKNKLAGIQSGAEVNVNADWNAISGDAYILNKPTSFPPSIHTHSISDVDNLQTALDGKESRISAGTTAQYWRGDKTWQTLNKSAVGLSNVDNTSDVDKPISTATQSALNAKANIVDIPSKTSFTHNILVSNWNLVSGKYEAVISNAGILANSFVDVIPSNDHVDIVRSAQIYPSVLISAGSVKVYSKFLPSGTITVTININ